MRSLTCILVLAAFAACAPRSVGTLPTGDASLNDDALLGSDVPPVTADAPTTTDAPLVKPDAPIADAPAVDVPSLDALAPDVVTADTPSADAVPMDAAAPDVVLPDAPDVVLPDAPADVPPPPDVPPTRCMSSRMCPGQVCDTTRGLCVDCLTMVDCAMGQRCVGDRCVAPPPTCRSDRDCSSRNQVCNLTRMECVDCVTDRDCGAGQFCDPDGACRPQVCTPGEVTCVDATTRGECSANGSRRTDSACPSGANASATCSAGVCGIRCAEGFANCDGDALNGCETNLASSSAHCGECGRRCGAEQVCAQRSCVAGPCPSGQQRCAGVCTDPSRDNSNCGGCGRACTVDQTCSAGACVARSCPNGQTSCGGACVDTSSDTRNCGSCGRVCTLPLCVLGSCLGSPQCGSGQTACGTSCVNLQNDPANCGTCNSRCSTGQSCSSGACTSATPLLFSITWNATNDVDLWVLTPSGQTVSYSNLMAGGGVHGGDSRTMGPETATWSATPPSGTYVLCAIPFAIMTSTTVRFQIQRYGAVVSSGTRTYSSSAPMNTRCSAGSTYEVGRIVW